jgi:hypothetical protein
VAETLAKPAGPWKGTGGHCGEKEGPAWLVWTLEVEVARAIWSIAGGHEAAAGQGDDHLTAHRLHGLPPGDAAQAGGAQSVGAVRPGRADPGGGPRGGTPLVSKASPTVTCLPHLFGAMLLLDTDIVGPLKGCAAKPW